MPVACLTDISCLMLDIFSQPLVAGPHRLCNKFSASREPHSPLHGPSSHVLGRTWVSSPNAGQDGVPLALVLVAKFLAVSPLLLPRPHTHLAHSDDDEDDRAQAPVD